MEPLRYRHSWGSAPRSTRRKRPRGLRYTGLSPMLWQKLEDCRPPLGR